MKSSKQRRSEIKERRLARAARLQHLDALGKISRMPSGAVAADHDELKHNNTYGLLPDYYMDRPFVCRDCGSNEIWTAKQQKWWYETMKGHIDSRAVRCRACRKKIRDAKARQKRHMEEMAARQPHPHEAFFKSGRKTKT